MRRPFNPPEKTETWQTGDIFFSVGNSWRSVAVRLFDGENSGGVTHCGFVLVENGEPYLVHMSTEMNKIVEESVDEYIRVNNVSEIIVKRLKEPVDTIILRKRITELMALPKEFDNDFNHRDSTQYYCTEFVVRELGKLGRHEFDDLLNKNYVYPVDLANRNVFTKP